MYMYVHLFLCAYANVDRLHVYMANYIGKPPGGLSKCANGQYMEKSSLQSGEVPACFFSCVMLGQSPQTSWL